MFKIPEGIKKGLGAKPKESLLLFQGKDFLIIKKIEKSSLSERFDNLSTTISKKFRKRMITQADVQGAIQWAKKNLLNL